MDKYEKERYDQFTKDSEGDLVTKYCNAKTTYMQALGHTKALLNQIRVKEIETVLKERHIDIPTDDRACEVGVFNGTGAV